MVPMERETRLADRCVRRCLLIGGTAAIDRWGPGARVPTIIISPFAKRHFIDHTMKPLVLGTIHRYEENREQWGELMVEQINAALAQPGAPTKEGE